MRKVLYLFVFIIILSLFATAVVNRSGLLVNVAQVRQTTIAEYIEEQGRTSLPRIYKITMPLEGRIREIPFREGQKVKKEELLAQLDTADLETNVIVTRSRLQTILSRIVLNEFNSLEKTALKESQNTIESVQNTVKASEKKVEASKAKHDFSKWSLEKSEELYLKDNATLQQFKQDKTSATQARVDYESDQLMTNALKAIETTTRLLPIYINQFLERKKLSREILLKEKVGAEAELEQAQRNLKRAQIVSPIEGVILKRYIVNERVLPAGTELMNIGNLDHLEITADILSEEAFSIERGSPVEIRCGNLDQAFLGKVLRITPQGFAKQSSLGVEQQRVEVVMSIDPGSLQTIRQKYHSLGLNYRVRVKIYTDRHEKALTIPRSALFLDQKEQWQIFIVENKQARKVDVEVGLMNPEEVEILSGVEAKDIVILAPDASLDNGTRVEVLRNN